MARSVVLALVVFAAIAAPAHADRYAAPDGSGTACTQEAPCALGQALMVMDVVWAAPGEYGPFNAGMFAFDLRGEDRTRPPVIRLDAVSLAPASLRDVHVERSGGTGPAVDRPTSGPIRLERVTVINRAGGPGVKSDTVNAFDTYVLAELGIGVHIQGAPAGGTIRNLTSYADSAAIGVQGNGGESAVTVVNSILRGGTDVGAQGALVDISYSNFQSTVVEIALIDEGAGNQKDVEPLLADPTSGDPTPLPASPTIDAGTTAGTGAEAWLAFPRALGDGPDIGAAEYAPVPLVTTLDATGVSDATATLRASADGRGLPGEVFFEYGPTTAYGSTTPAQPLGAPVGAALTGLALNTTYHFRAVATTRAGTAAGSDRTFTTGPPPTPADTAAPVFSDLTLSARRFRVASFLTPVAAALRGTTLSYTLSEPAAVRITIQRARKGRRRGGKCRPGARRGKRCTNWKRLARLTRGGSAGGNRLPFSGRIGSADLSKRLKPGRYRFSLVATDAAGNASRPQRIRFRVTRR